MITVVYLNCLKQEEDIAAALRTGEGTASYTSSKNVLNSFVLLWSLPHLQVRLVRLCKNGLASVKWRLLIPMNYQVDKAVV